MLKLDYPSPEQIAWFKREYEIIRRLNPSTGSGVSGVVMAYSLETEHQRWLMALEDFGGDSLSQLGLAGQIEWTDFLRLALAIVEILGQIHQQHIIHKGVTKMSCEPHQTARGSS
jgi:serine/threonine protein kinase